MSTRRLHLKSFFVAAALALAGLAGAQEDGPPSCSADQKVPRNLQAVTAALDLCQTIDRISASGTRIFGQNLLTDRDTSTLTMAAQARITLASLQLTSETAELDKIAIRNAKRALTAQGRLGIASAVVGIIGGGAGGSLHLVNNPQVGHAATVVGISAGILGGSIGGINQFVCLRSRKA